MLKIKEYSFTIKPSKAKIDIVQHVSKHCQKEINYSFDSNHKEVKIGRDKSCEIIVDWGDKSFSKFQCTIKYDEFLYYWTIKDGGPEQNSPPSKNGSWIYAPRSFEIEAGMIFKIDNNKILISYS